MIDVSFNDDGTVKIFAMQNGVILSVTAPANQLQALLPAHLFEDITARMAAFLALYPGVKRMGA